MTEPARFPISGAIYDPAADDYDLEAALLRQEGAALKRTRRLYGEGLGGDRLYEHARRFERVARRKRWSEQLLSQRNPITALAG